MHKGFTSNFIALFLKFIVVLSILEGYFLFSFFSSKAFLSVAINLIEEAGSITLR